MKLGDLTYKEWRAFEAGEQAAEARHWHHVADSLEKNGGDATVARFLARGYDAVAREAWSSLTIAKGRRPGE